MRGTSDVSHSNVFEFCIDGTIIYEVDTHLDVKYYHFAPALGFAFALAVGAFVLAVGAFALPFVLNILSLLKSSADGFFFSSSEAASSSSSFYSRKC